MHSPRPCTQPDLALSPEQAIMGDREETVRYLRGFLRGANHEKVTGFLEEHVIWYKSYQQF